MAGVNSPGLRGTDFEADGRALLRIWHNLPDDPLYDRALIDAWATSPWAGRLVSMAALSCAAMMMR